MKTRLAEALGAAQAAEVYRTFVEVCTQRFALDDCRLVLAYSPDDQRTRRQFEELLPAHWELQPQIGGDLGQRMASFFSDSFSAGAQRVVLLGTDCPHLPVELIEQAFARLRDHRVVLGPSEDGGYYLVGASGGVPDIFDAIAWSTPQVWEATVERLRSQETSFHVLDRCYDIDRLPDLQRLISDLRDDEKKDPALTELHAKLQKLTPT